ncbi:hypothetical protein QCA50_013203 [Cerrena zonata]|uniref:UPF3 domain-containing protein n=1 Tax=Cerrena zonata TaxID=2478898 RepID=A0AAW0FUN0_9APHY
MAADAIMNEPPHKAKTKDKDKERKGRSSGKGPSEPRLKTVVRRLPPNLPENVFWQSVDPWVKDETVTWKVYYQGKFRKRLNKENIPSRAYIAFKNEELLTTFSREYDGHLFRDKAGNESTAIVEFAPYQKVPSEKKKIDSRIGTIEKDEDYISFLKSLEDASAKAFDIDNLETLVVAAQAPPLPTTTPLLEALKAEKSAQKEKEALARTQAHFKEHPPTIAVPPKREESKKKGAAAPPSTSTKPADQQAPPTPGKKAAKKAAAAAKAAAQQETSNASASSPKSAPKQPRSEPPTPKKQRQAKAAAGNVQSPPPPALIIPPVDTATSSAPAPVTTNNTTQQAVAPPRRRPVIGLASRQFEAALSGAGVKRRERGKDQSAADTPTEVKPTKVAKEKPIVPIILQREVTVPVQAAPRVPSAATREDAPRGGRGRGRGRGKGRGG